MRLALLLLALFVLAACSEDKPPYPPRQPPAGMLDDRTQIAAGHALFARLCASCHGHTEEGRNPRANFFTPPAQDFRESRYRELDPAFLYWRIATGKNEEPYATRGSVMPAWGPTLNETEIWQLVAYLRSRASD